MKKKVFALLAAVLCIQTLECEEGGTCQLTEEQLGKLEDHINTLQGKIDESNSAIAQRDQTIADLQSQIRDKDAEIAALGKKPADDSKQVNNEGGKTTVTETNELKDFCDDMAEAQKMLDQLRK